MAILNIIFNRKVLAQIGGITIDASIDEDHSLECEPTENPVEDGADVTDHVDLKPSSLTINGMISDSPIDFGILSGVAGAVNTVRNLGGEKRSIEQYNKMVELRNKRQPFEVVTGLKVYQNMILKSLKVNRNATNANAIYFNAELQEIRIVKASVGGDDGGLVPSPLAGVKDLASKTKNLGQKIGSVLDTVRDARLLQNAGTVFSLVRSLPLNA